MGDPENRLSVYSFLKALVALLVIPPMLLIALFVAAELFPGECCSDGGTRSRLIGDFWHSPGSPASIDCKSKNGRFNILTPARLDSFSVRPDSFIVAYGRETGRARGFNKSFRWTIDARMCSDSIEGFVTAETFEPAPIVEPPPPPPIFPRGRPTR